MLKKAIFTPVLLFVCLAARAQTTFLPLGSEGYHFIDRWETMSGRLCDSLANGDKPESRRNIMNFIEAIRPDTVKFSANGSEQTTLKFSDLRLGNKLSDVDLYRMRQMMSESGEWVPGEDGAINSRRSIFNTFYKKQYNLGYVKTDNFFVVVNPVLSGIVLRQRNTPPVVVATNYTIPEIVYGNSQGAEVRGWIAKKIGFYTMVTDNQERYPYHVTNWVQKKLEAIPGADYFKKPTSQFGSYDYLQVSGYVNADLVKNHVSATFGYGKHFFGDGTTSLFLTDNSSNMPFLRLQTRIWKLNYECLYLELTPQYVKGADKVMPHKYATIRYMNMNVARWLNLGIFEGQVFARTGGYEISYLNPIILSTAMSRYNGAGDKSIIGLDAKVIFARHFQLYGQFLLNEFRIKELTGNRKWYGNKWGIQVGGKYFNAFGLDNIDLQGEINIVRPYTYSAQDTIANYTNYNQPLADPLGSGYIKNVGQIFWQAGNKLSFTARMTYYIKGNDTGTANLGNNIFKAYPTRASEYGVSMINGPKSTCQMLSLNASYEARPNMFLDAGIVYRNYTNVSGQYPTSSTIGPIYSELTTNYFYFGVRMNTRRRAYDFF